MYSGRILLVDDEASARNAMGKALEQAGYQVTAACDAFEALKLLETFEPDLTLADLMMPGMSGLDLLKAIRARDPDAQLVLVSGYRDVETAVEAMHSGAFHFLCKPVDIDTLLAIVEKALNARELRRQAASHFPPAPTRLLGESREIKAVLETVNRVASSKATVLITGESGTGKELVAEALHQGSPRARGPLIRVNCAALADGVLESELFGHERGAFTGASQQRKGRLEQANGGTLFLDEVGELSHAVQVKLLRFLQERTFERVGGNEPIKVDVRIVAATNRDLREQVAKGAFREDLFYRLNVIGLHLPSLRERPTDIPLLATSFLEKYALANDRPARKLDDAALAALVSYAWPGNVRELQNVIERAVVLANGPVVEQCHLPESIVGALSPVSSGPRVPGASLQELERHAILSTLQANGGSTVKAARVLGISVRKIQYRVQQYAKARRSGLPPIKPSSAA
ncbi:MAG TPA: sigma-54 dependent transcriptional regulator [Polyangiaceae bacterium]|nr:sigma-54 dependent transcriptional regulator [Polyangiaceae bacterium]